MAHSWWDIFLRVEIHLSNNSFNFLLIQSTSWISVLLHHLWEPTVCTVLHTVSDGVTGLDWFPNQQDSTSIQLEDFSLVGTEQQIWKWWSRSNIHSLKQNDNTWFSGHFRLEIARTQNEACSLPFDFLKAGILKEGSSLEVLFFALSRTVLCCLSGVIGDDPFTIGPNKTQKHYI